MSDLAKRAIACKGWRWMPGMRGHDRGKTFVVISAARDSYTVRFDLPVKQPRRRRPLDLWRFERSGGPPALPDLTDPATLGCFLALVAQAHGVSLDDAQVVRTTGHGVSLDDAQVVRTTGRVWSVWVFRPDGSPWRVATHEPSRDEALVVALEAAP